MSFLVRNTVDVGNYKSTRDHSKGKEEERVYNEKLQPKKKGSVRVEF